ncbi:hypothetical protein GCM10028777_13120 [Angustibacter speluncae]
MLAVPSSDRRTDANTAPFRWDLVEPAALGGLLDGVATPALWFARELSHCAGKVLARSASGDLAFVGRSLDSMFDLLSGALSDIDEVPTLTRIPLSFARDWDGPERRRLSLAERDVARSVLESSGMTPHVAARRSTPVTFVDVAYTGGTFRDLYLLIREWVEDERAQWDVVRKKIRFLGVTSRTKTSPNTFRWAQHQEWTKDLPGKSVTSVSLDAWVWSYLGNEQPKLTRSYAPRTWLAEAQGPGRDERTRAALAEAVALVAYGRTGEARHLIADAMADEPALAQSWLRTLRSRLASRI